MSAWAICVYCFILFIVVGVIELPMCCHNVAIFRCIYNATSKISQIWSARGILYLALSAGGYAVYHFSKGKTFILLIPIIVLSVSGALYLAGSWIRGEPNPIVVKGDTTLPISAKQAEPAATGGSKRDSKAPAFGGGLFSSAGSPTSYEAPSDVGQVGITVSNSVAPPGFFNEEDNTSKARPAENSGNSKGFSGYGSTSYGFNNGIPTENPFLS